MSSPQARTHVTRRRFSPFLGSKILAVIGVAGVVFGCETATEKSPIHPYVPPDASPSGSSGGDTSSGSGGSPDTSSGGSSDTGGEQGTGGVSQVDSGSTEPDASGPDAGPPYVPTGTAISAPDMTWKWIDFPDSFCRDGSTAGIGVSLNSSSKKLMIYLDGDGACFDGATCLANAANIGLGQKVAQTSGVFDRTNTANPVKDWNVVYVPYCTGDVHAGTQPNGHLSDVLLPQKFVGYTNVKAFLNRVVPTFPGLTQVLLTGVGAGGFGAAANAFQVQHAFGKVPVTLVDDSGPPMASEYIPTCLQDKWRTAWGLDQSMLKDCGAGCPNHSDFFIDYAKHLATVYSKQKGGLIESNTDSVIAAFFGYGTNGCTGSVLTPLPPASMTAGILGFRTAISASPNFGTYYPNSSQHAWLNVPSLYTQTVGSTSLVSWLAGIVNGTAVTNVGP